MKRKEEERREETCRKKYEETGCARALTRFVNKRRCATVMHEADLWFFVSFFVNETFSGNGKSARVPSRIRPLNGKTVPLLLARAGNARYRARARA